jgi:hypothetical protein
MIAFAETLTEGQGWTLIGLVAVLACEQIRQNRTLARAVAAFAGKTAVQSERISALGKRVESLPDRIADEIERRGRKTG